MIELIATALSLTAFVYTGAASSADHIAMIVVTGFTCLALRKLKEMGA